MLDGLHPPLADLRWVSPSAGKRRKQKLSTLEDHMAYLEHWVDLRQQKDYSSEWARSNAALMGKKFDEGDQGILQKYPRCRTAVQIMSECLVRIGWDEYEVRLWTL